MSGCDVVSVVLPFFDPVEGFLREAVESVRKQTYSHWELILVDDGSPPNAGASAARTLVASMPERARLVTYDRPANRGASAARNQGLRHATGKYVAFLDADDVWLPDKLDRELEALHRNPTARLVCSNTRYWYSWEGSGHVSRDWVPTFGQSALYEPPGPLVQWLRGWSGIPPTSSVVACRETLEAVGGFEERFPGLYDDQVLYAKVCLAHPVLLLDTVTANYRQHPASLCASASVDQERRSRQVFLQWLHDYVRAAGIAHPPLLDALRSELWKARNPKLARIDRWLRKAAGRGAGRADVVRKSLGRRAR